MSDKKQFDALLKQIKESCTESLKKKKPMTDVAKVQEHVSKKRSLAVENTMKSGIHRMVHVWAV